MSIDFRKFRTQKCILSEKRSPGAVECSVSARQYEAMGVEKMWSVKRSKMCA